MARVVARIFGFDADDLVEGSNPFDLCGKSAWEVSGRTTATELFTALAELLPEGAIMRFEAGPARGRLKRFFDSNSVHATVEIPRGTLWPRSEVVDVPATPNNLRDLSEITERLAEPEVAEHFHVHLDGEVLIDWYDAFDDPMYLSLQFSEDAVRVFSDRLGMQYRRVEVGGEGDDNVQL